MKSVKSGVFYKIRPEGFGLMCCLVNACLAGRALAKIGQARRRYLAVFLDEVALLIELTQWRAQAVRKAGGLTKIQRIFPCDCKAAYVVIEVDGEVRNPGQCGRARIGNLAGRAAVKGESLAVAPRLSYVGNCDIPSGQEERTVAP